MHSTAVFRAAVLLVASQSCFARNVMPFTYNSIDTVPASYVETPQNAATGREAERMKLKWAEVAKQAEKEQIKVAYQAQVDEIEAQKDALLATDPRTSSNNVEATISEGHATFNSKRSPERLDGSLGPDSRPEWMKNMTAAQLREEIIYIRKALNNITFENHKLVTVQGYQNLMYDDFSTDCWPKDNGRNHFFLYHPVFQMMFPDWEESFLFYVETP